jgi:hypothetical protein
MLLLVEALSDYISNMQMTNVMEFFAIMNRIFAEHLAYSRIAPSYPSRNTPDLRFAFQTSLHASIGLARHQCDCLFSLSFSLSLYFDTGREIQSTSQLV